MKKLLVFLLFLSSLFYGCKEDEYVPEPLSKSEKYIFTNIRYGSDTLNKLDIMLPENRSKNSKVVIFIHGGGWISGDKKETIEIENYLCDSGYVTVSLNYRFANPEKGIDTYSILGDIKNAINFLQERSEYFGCSFNKLTLIGGSAGGHLSLMYALTLDPNKEVVRVVSMAGPTNLNDSLFKTFTYTNLLVTNVVGSTDSVKWAEVSPINFPSQTLIYLYHGKLDDIVPYQQSITFYNKFKAYNPNNKLTLFDDSGHAFTEAAYWQVVNEVFF